MYDDVAARDALCDRGVSYVEDPPVHAVQVAAPLVHADHPLDLGEAHEPFGQGTPEPRRGTGHRDGESRRAARHAPSAAPWANSGGFIAQLVSHRARLDI
jgi:hypothetical protein